MFKAKIYENFLAMIQNDEAKNPILRTVPTLKLPTVKNTAWKNQHVFPVSILMIIISETPCLLLTVSMEKITLHVLP